MTKVNPRKPIEVSDSQWLKEVRDARDLPPAEYPEIAFAGRSNAGKSSLINTLLRRRSLARTSSTPGCTRGVHFLRAQFGHATTDFVDLPGYGFAKRSKHEREAWRVLIEGYLTKRPSLKGMVLVVDARRGIEGDDLDLLTYAEHIGQIVLVAGTKIDKLSANARYTAVKNLKTPYGTQIFPFSATQPFGRDELLFAIQGLAFGDVSATPVQPLLQPSQ